MQTEDFYLWPLETLRGRYLAPLGGYSPELLPNEIGINKFALLKNTVLSPYLDRVIISKLEGIAILPLFMREQFIVIPLTEEYPEALSKSLSGEVVLPEEKINSLEVRLRTGDEVILNSVINDLSSNWAGKHIKLS